MIDRPSDDELQELIDGRLGGERLLTVHAYLAQDPELAARVQTWRGNDLKLQRYGRHLLAQANADPGAKTPIDGSPKRSIKNRNLERGGQPQRLSIEARRFAPTAAVFALVALLGAGAGWTAAVFQAAPGHKEVRRIVSDVTTAYDFVGGMAGGLLDFTPDEADAFGQWTREALGIPIMPPDLSDAGYTYEGARVFPSSDRIASVLTYRGNEGTSIAVYCWRGRDQLDRLPPEVKQEDYQLLFKTTHGVGLAVVGTSKIPDFRAIGERMLSAFSDLISANVKRSSDGDMPG